MSFLFQQPHLARLQPDEGVQGAGCQLPSAALSLLQENLKWTSVSFLFPSLSSCRSQAESHFTSRPSPLSPSPPFCTFTVSHSVKCWGPNGRWKWRFSRGTLHAKCSEIFSAAASYFVAAAASKFKHVSCRLVQCRSKWTTTLSIRTCPLAKAASVTFLAVLCEWQLSTFMWLFSPISLWPRSDRLLRTVWWISSVKHRLPANINATNLVSCSCRCVPIPGGR